jgi:mono/diheme cytochrome c family protein
MPAWPCSIGSAHIRGFVVLWAALAAAAIGVASGFARAQTTGGQPPRLTIESMAGREVFEFYCAPCHGRSGRGDGPVAAALTTRPTDVTLLARQRGGVFPGAEVRTMLAGSSERPTPAHGSREMPVWGPIFRALDPDARRAEARLAGVVSYLESIQVK